MGGSLNELFLLSVVFCRHFIVVKFNEKASAQT